MSGSPNSATEVSSFMDSCHRAARNAGVTTKAMVPSDGDPTTNPRGWSSSGALQARVHPPTTNTDRSPINRVARQVTISCFRVDDHHALSCVPLGLLKLCTVDARLSMRCHHSRILQI